MAEVGVQEPSLPCKSLAGGEGSGWPPCMEERGEAALSCLEEEEEDPRLGPFGEEEEDPGGMVGGGDPRLEPFGEEEEDPGGMVGGDPRLGQQEEAWRELGRKRHRRRPSRKRRQFKPYDMLSWEEKKRLEEKDARRASRVRAQMFAKGQPVAPYNTTQFLMEDHDLEEPDLCPPQRRAPAALPALQANSFSKGDSTEEDEEEDGTGSDGMGSDNGSDFLQKDFSETYEKYHVESLQDMSKPELIREYMELEKCLSRMEDDNNRLRSQQDSKIRDLEMELEKVKEENQRLLREQVVVAAAPSGHGHH